MAEKQDYIQSELFTQSLDGTQYKPQHPKDSFFRRMRGSEKTLLLLMAVVLVSIVSFSLGVEQGKQVVLIENESKVSDIYTIQVVGFKSRAPALREAQVLAKKGLAPLAFTKGDSIVLCVGKFSNQESAQPLLVILQKTYAGCRIRRL